MMESFSFTASLPPIQSAISVSGQWDGARVKLDIPQSELEGNPEAPAAGGERASE